MKILVQNIIVILNDFRVAPAKNLQGDALMTE